jgi:uroporphyrinogen-III synthase
VTATPLTGKRILVTRTARHAGNLQQALEAQGAVVVPLPTIAIEPPASYAPLDAALARAESYHWLILTSANGARAMGERMRALKLAPDRLAHLQVACVGEATAKAAAEAGLAVSLVPKQSVAEGLVEALSRLEYPIAGQRVLLVRAAVARDLVPDQLRRMGAHVQIVEAYRTVVPSQSIESVRVLLAPGAVTPDAVTFTSSSTVTNFLDLLRAAGVERPAALIAVSIGPITSGTLREHGWEPAAEAARASIDGLVEACVRSFGG